MHINIKLIRGIIHIDAIVLPSNLTTTESRPKNDYENPTQLAVL